MIIQNKLVVLSISLWIPLWFYKSYAVFRLGILPSHPSNFLLVSVWRRLSRADRDGGEKGRGRRRENNERRKDGTTNNSCSFVCSFLGGEFEKEMALLSFTNGLKASAVKLLYLLLFVFKSQNSKLSQALRTTTSFPVPF